MPEVVSVMGAASAFLIVGLTYMEHRRSVRPSLLFTLGLVVNLLNDVESKQVSPFVPEQCWRNHLPGAAVALKLVMIELQDRSKRQLLADDDMRKTLGDHAGGGVFRGLLSFSLNPLVAGGYWARVFMQRSGQIDPEQHPALLLRQLKKCWTMQQVPGPARPGDLFIASLKTWQPILQPLFLSRLTLTALKCAHPFVLRRVIETVEKQYDETSSTSECCAVFGAAIAIFLGTALAQEHFSHLMACYTARLRGGLTALEFDKLQKLTEADAKKSASAALVSTDIDVIVDNMPNFLVVPILIFELGAGSSLLSWLIDAPASVVYLPVISSSFACYILARMTLKHITNWNESMNRRVSSTSRIIQQLTAIKMVGLGPTIREFLHRLRIAETQASMPVGAITATISFFTTIADLGVPAAAIGAAISASFFNSGMSAAKAFPLLSIIFTILTSLPHIIGSMSIMMSLVPCFARMQGFLQLPERKDCRITSDAPMAIDLTPDSGDVICFNHADIAPHRTMSAILREVCFRLTRGSVTAVIGPHGAGKSTFLRAILGDSEVSAGSVQVNETEIGYCGEDVWLQEATIRENIIGVLPYNAPRYTAAIRACFLDSDLERLPGGDNYIVGVHGSNLSDGQRQRIGIARAIYAQHNITLLDDVFRSLDIETAICILHQLCGRNSILRRAGCTVVVVTSLPQCLEVIDQLVFLDGQGNATLDHTYLNPPGRQRVATALRTLNLNNNALLVAENRQQSAIFRYLQANGRHGSRQTSRKQTISDWGLFWLAIKPLGRFRALAHSLLVLAFSAAEILPDVYLRFWIDFYPEDPSLYATYASLTLVSAVLGSTAYFNTLVWLSPRISVSLHKTLIETVVQSTLAFFELSHVGKLLNLFNEDMLLISKDLPRSILRIMYAGFEALIMIFFILSGNNYIAVSLPVILIYILVRARRFCLSWRDIRLRDDQKRRALCTFFDETAASLTHPNFFYRREQRLEDGMRVLAESQISFYHKAMTKKRLRLSTDLLGTGLIAILLAPAFFVQGISTATSIGLAYYTVVSLPRILYEAILAFSNLDTSLAAVLRLYEFVRRAPLEIAESSVELPPNWPSVGTVELRNASMHYMPTVDNAPAVFNITLSIAPGQHLGIGGRSGSGKSSLVLMLLGFVRYEGECQIDGIDVSSLAPDVLRSRLVTITQEPVILQGTIRTNLLPLTLNDTKQSWRYAHDAQKDVELEHLLKRLHIWLPLAKKGGLDADIDDVGYSKGDTQLLCIARAILRQRETGSRVVLVDDATSCLNMEKERIANDLMRDCFQGCTVLRMSARQSGLEGVNSVTRFRRGALLDPNEADDDSDSGSDVDDEE